jgi:hypothetical protein
MVPTKEAHAEARDARVGCTFGDCSDSRSLKGKHVKLGTQTNQKLIQN